MNIPEINETADIPGTWEQTTVAKMNVKSDKPGESAYLP